MTKKLSKPSAISPKQKKYLFSRLSIIVILGAVMVMATLPGYFQWQWSWSDLATPANLGQIIKIRDRGIEIPDWTITDQKTIQINQHKWSAQIFETPQGQRVTIFIKPQPYYKDKPEVEWMDFQGFIQWRTDSQQTLSFEVPRGNNQGKHWVEARYFRGWTSAETFAALQWYAWSEGGSFQPKKWFLQDQIAQISGKRQPWLAVIVLIKIEPLSDIQLVASQAEEMGIQIQTILNQILVQSTNPVN